MKFVSTCSVLFLRGRSPLWSRWNLLRRNSEWSLFFKSFSWKMKKVGYRDSISVRERPVTCMICSEVIPMAFRLRAISNFSSRRPFSNPSSTPFFNTLLCCIVDGSQIVTISIHTIFIAHTVFLRERMNINNLFQLLKYGFLSFKRHTVQCFHVI